MRLDGHSRRATRRNSFCNGVTFTQRPIRLYEQVRLRLVAVRPGWSGALRFGFTAHDPSLMSAQDIPKYACPDLVTRPGYWAKALPENLALRDTVLAYWADRHGRVFYSVNDGEPVLFHCGVAVGGPLWALIDVYGITDEVQLLGRSVGTACTFPVFTAPGAWLTCGHPAAQCVPMCLEAHQSNGVRFPEEETEAQSYFCYRTGRDPTAGWPHALASQLITFRTLLMHLFTPSFIPLFLYRLPQSWHAFPLLALTHSCTQQMNLCQWAVRAVRCSKQSQLFWGSKWVEEALTVLKFRIWVLLMGKFSPFLRHRMCSHIHTYICVVSI